MGIKRFYADSDNTITNAFKANLSTRGTGSNMGESDVLEVFSIYGQADSGSQELSRVLVNFPFSDISTARTAGNIPDSGSVSFYLRMFNAKHSETVPEQYTLIIQNISSSWSEGVGLDMEDYEDDDASNWEYRTDAATWSSIGGDYYNTFNTDASASQYFDVGNEDVFVDVSELVERNLISSGTEKALPNYGFGVMLSASYEAAYSTNTSANSASIIHNPNGASRSYYTKRFFARGSEFFFKRPILEARWDSAKKDDRGRFQVSSSLVTGEDNLNTLYLYNYVRGELKNIPGVADGSGKIFVKLHTSVDGTEVLTPVGSGAFTVKDNFITGGFKETGVYTASFALDTTASTVYDRWQSGSTIFHTASFKPTKFEAHNHNPIPTYFCNITNLKPAYHRDENPKLRVYSRQKDWSPTVYSVASKDISHEVVEESYYKVMRVVDAQEIIPYGTGSDKFTKLSYDVSGNYFDFDMDMLEAGYAYMFRFLYKVNGSYIEQPETFKFRVESEQ